MILRFKKTDCKKMKFNHLEIETIIYSLLN